MNPEDGWDLKPGEYLLSEAIPNFPMLDPSERTEENARRFWSVNLHRTSGDVA